MHPLRELERLGRAATEIPKADIRAADCVLLASFPKSGNTWLRFMLANLSRSQGGHDIEVDFQTIGRYVPDIRRNRRLTGRITSPGFPLFLKTHFPWIRGFVPFRAVVVVRDPVDTLVSHYRHLTQGAGKRLPRIERFIRHWRYGAGAWRDWYRSWRGHTNAVVRYEDLLSDPDRELQRLLEALEIRTPSGSVADAVARSSRDNMRRLQAERGDPNLRNPDFRFVNQARAGAGTDLLAPAEIEYVRRKTQPVAGWYGYKAGDITP